MSDKFLFQRTERTSEPGDDYRIAIGTGLANALNITWAKLKTWFYHPGNSNLSTVDWVAARIGINTSTFKEKLTVNGAANIQGSLTAASANSVTISQETGFGRIMALGADATTKGALTLGLCNSDTSGYVAALLINNTGAATFASSLTVASINATNLSTGYIPYYDGTKLVDGPLKDSLGASVPLKENLFDVLNPTIIRNKEFNNQIIGTPWTITAINTTTKVITFDNPIPFIPEFNTRVNTFDYWSAGYSQSKAVRIESANYSANTITYTNGYGVLAVGNQVTFFNPFRNGEMLSTSPLLSPVAGTWTETYMAPGGVWKHSDDTYRLVVMGLSGKMRLGLASSPDLINWTLIGSTFKYETNVAPFNESWMSTTGNLNTMGSPVKIKNSNLYYMQFATQNTSGLTEIFTCVIDEDFGIIRVGERLLTPGKTNTNGITGGGMIYNEGKYSVFAFHRYPLLVDWELYEFEIDDPISGNITTSTLISKGDGVTGSWMSSHIDQSSPIIYNGKLYLFVGGTGTGSKEIYASNREFGIFSKDLGVWENYKSNPLVCNPILGNYIWDAALAWAADHAGGNISLITEDNYLYLFLSMNFASDTYKITGYKFSLLA